MTTNNKSRGIAKRSVQDQENNLKPMKMKGVRSIPMKKNRTEESAIIELPSNRKHHEECEYNNLEPYELMGE